MAEADESIDEQQLQVAKKAMESGHGEDAVRIYGKMLKQDPDNAELLAYRGAARYDLGDFEGAEADLVRALELAPDAMHPNYYLGLVKLRMGDLRGASAFQKKALALAKDGEERSAVLDAMGQIAFYQQDYGKAIAHFSASIEGKESYPAYSHRAVARIKQGDYEAAEADYARLMELYPNNGELYHQRGICRGKEGKYNAALEDLTMAISLDPQNPALYNDRGYTYACKKKFQEAIEDYTMALSLDAKFRLAYVNRAAAYEKTGKNDLARRDRALLEQLMEFEEG